MILFFGYKNCSSCRSAEKFLAAHQVDYRFVDITTAPPSPELLTQYVKTSGLDVKKFLNTSGEVYRSLGLKDKLASLKDNDIIELLASNGRLLKRPLIADAEGQVVTVGGKEETLKAWL